MSIPRNHHYIPAFYLRGWENEAGKLTEYSKPQSERFQFKDVSAEATGFKRDLYRIPGEEALSAQVIETEVLRPLDNKAARILPILVECPDELSRDDRYDWSRFLMSLVVRTPEDLAERKDFVKNDWIKVLATVNDYARNEKDPAAVAKWLDAMTEEKSERVALYLFVDFFSRKGCVDFVSKMQWSILKVPQGQYSLLTSDRPMICTNGISKTTDYIIFPLNRNTIFCAANNRDTIEALAKSRTLSQDVNNTIAQRASRYVWSTNRSHCKFVERRMSKTRPPSLVSMMRSNLGLT